MDLTEGSILIVDDEPALLKMLSVYLRRLGYEVVTADATDQAWTMADAAPHPFAAAVLDASMDGMSMQELATRLLGSNRAICVLAASGYPVDMTSLDVVAPGRVAFLHKPFTPEMLAAALRRLLAAQEEV